MSESATPICPAGHSNPAEARFCTECGAAVADSPAPPPPPAVPAGWWLASDGRMYPPTSQPDVHPPGWWQAPDGRWYPPAPAPASPAFGVARSSGPGPVSFSDSWTTARSTADTMHLLGVKVALIGGRITRSDERVFEANTGSQARLRTGGPGTEAREWPVRIRATIDPTETGSLVKITTTDAMVIGVRAGNRKKFQESVQGIAAYLRIAIEGPDDPANFPPLWDRGKHTVFGPSGLVGRAYANSVLDRQQQAAEELIHRGVYADLPSLRPQQPDDRSVVYTSDQPTNQPTHVGLAAELERLTVLHASGHLSDDEFIAAKAALLSPKNPKT